MTTPKLAALFLAAFAIASHAATYYITGSGTSFSASKANAGGAAITGGSGVTISNLMTAIRTDAAGSATTIQFGDNSTVLDIGTAYITFDGSASPAWASSITLTGKITSSADGTISLTNGASITSTAAEITSTDKYCYAISNNAGTVTISGGTVTSDQYIAISNNAGTVTINGGTVKGAGAIDSYGNGTVTISNGTVMGSVSNSGTGTVNISGGTVSATDGRAVYISSTGKIIVSGNAKVTPANTSSTDGTIVISSSSTETANRLEITGGTVENTAATGNAVYNESTGGILLSNNPISSPIGKIPESGESGFRQPPTPSCSQTSHPTQR
ncbi:hypothetical protein R83H12_02343 [Fibrobacteria bacterium R8-3-H12]